MSVSNRLPVAVTPLFGRDQELAALEGLVQRREAHLVTLTGPGGVGKTRLAVEVARRLSPEFREGVFLVDLAPVTHRDGVLSAIAHALAIREGRGSTLAEDVLAHLSPRQTLLVLDNFEHVLHAAPTIAQLLAAAPELRILVTSRGPLRLRGEQVFPVTPLRLPDTDAVVTPANLAANPAVALFVHHARGSRPGFTVTERNAVTIASICRRLDGLPLALELAAAWLRLLAPDELLQHLDDRLALLADGPRDMPPRHQTLRRTLDWSYDLLDMAARRLFRQLALFEGGCDLDALAAVTSATADAAAHTTESLVTVVGALVDQGLSQVVPRDGSATRYAMLETIREYGRARSTPAERAAFAERHADYYLRLVQRAEPHLRGAEQIEWLARLEVDAENLRVALGWALGQGRIEDTLRTVVALAQYWRLRGRRREGATWLDQALAGQPTIPAALAAAALYTRGLLAWELGEYARARERFEASLSHATQVGEPRGIANALAGLGLVALADGDFEQATRLYEQSLVLRQEAGDGWEIGHAHLNLGLAALATVRLDGSRAHFQASLAAYDELGDHAGSAQAWLGLGEVARCERRWSEARACYERSLALAVEVGDDETRAWCLHNLGYVALAEERPSGARPLFGDSLTLFAAREDAVGVAHGVAGVAAVAAATGQTTPAITLLAAAESELRRLHARPALPDQQAIAHAVATVRQQLDTEAFDAAWQAGQVLAFAAALDLARAALSTPDGPSAVASEASLRIHALGPVQVFHQGQPIPPRTWRYATAQELLFFLLCEGPATKEVIGLALWPDASPAQLRSQFHRSLHHLRQALGGAEWITRHDSRYAFNRALAYWFDVEAFEASVDTLATPPASPQSLISTLQSLYSGDFLADLEVGEWATPHRERLRRLYLDALIRAGTALLEVGDHAHAATTFMTAIAQDGYLEAAHRGLMVALARGGEHAKAIDHYARLVTLLHDELDTAPAPETIDLYERLRRGERA
ncbi:MAG: tetratricopeptide repeat protein [Anaerolineae bacterium]|nr:tetratricopeptide repeat protein [Anaerolineae bacterium]